MFREEGVSGTVETTDRPACGEMLQALHSNGVKAIMVEKLDRLARDLMVQEAAIGDLHRSGFELISVADPDLMAKDPTLFLMRQLMGAVAQYDKGLIVLKLAGARKRAATGRCEGRKPHGFYPGEAAIKARMEELRTEGLGFDHIAANLNEEGMGTRTCAKWHGVVVNRILTGKGLR